jgi:hypothetical protein
LGSGFAVDVAIRFDREKRQSPLLVKLEAIEVLYRPPNLRLADQGHYSLVRENSHVVADVRERQVETFGDLARAEPGFLYQCPKNFAPRWML